MKPVIYPHPRQMRLHGRDLRLVGNRIRMSYSPSEALEEALLRFCKQHELQLTVENPAAEQLLIDIRRKPGTPESYELIVNENGISLSAPDDAGIFYGLCSLQQILEQSVRNNKQTTMTALHIRDEPDFRHRGIMLDVSRCKVPTLETLFSMIDRFARLKLNQLHLYIEHTFAFANHRPVWEHASPFTAEEILQIKQYCRSRFIDLVPNLNSFGHFERWLRHENYRSYAECPDGFTHPLSGVRMTHGSTLKPNGHSLNLLHELYSEYLPLFDSPYFNIGGDEPWELGHGWSADMCRQEGTDRVYLSFMSKIQNLVSQHDRRMMFWSDIVLQHPESLSSLSSDLIALDWGYEANHDFDKECRQIADCKIPFYVCPGTSSWNSLTGRTGNAMGNLDNAARHGLAHGADGYLITDWGDHGHHQYLPISYPGFVTGACHAWHHDAAASVDIEDALCHMDSGEIAAIIPAMGRVPDLAPSTLRNGTIFNRLLFWDMQQEPPEISAIPKDQVLACLNRFTEIREELEPLTGNQATDELANATDMAIHGLRRLTLVRGYHDDIPGLKRDISRIIDRHQDLWLARNRPGGLQESVAYLRDSEAAL